MMKLWVHKDREEKIAFIEERLKCLPDDLKAYLPTPLADIWDWNDYWIPWLLNEVKKGR